MTNQNQRPGPVDRSCALLIPELHAYREQLKADFGCDCEPQEFSHGFTPPKKGEFVPRWIGDRHWEHAISPHCCAMSHLQIDNLGWMYPVAFGWGDTAPVHISGAFLLSLDVLPGLWIDPHVLRAGEEMGQRFRCRQEPDTFRLAVGWPEYYYDPTTIRCLCWVKK